MLAEGGVIGVQVLNELTNVVRRKLGWDWIEVGAALIVAAAADAGCSVLFTEDLQHGRRFGGVTIQSPFLEET